MGEMIPVTAKPLAMYVECRLQNPGLQTSSNVRGHFQPDVFRPPLDNNLCNDVYLGIQHQCFLVWSQYARFLHLPRLSMSGSLFEVGIHVWCAAFHVQYCMANKGAQLK